ncbi:MAG: MopE-related protein [Myxococcota bacterium]|nr:MopE-related protein [Myxococcota bacterium]
MRRPPINPHRARSPFGTLLFASFLALGLGACGEIQLAMEAGVVDFGEVAVGSTATEQLDIQVTQGAPAFIGLSIDPEDGPFFLGSLPDPVLSGDGPHVVSLRFHPEALGSELAVLVLEISNVEGTSHQEVILSGAGAVGPLDLDRDGFDSSEDCNDDLATVHPGAEELCDGLDGDCDGVLPEDEADLDTDGWAACGGDCDDDDAETHPGAKEICDGLDNDCDGDIGEDDGDGDGYRVCDGDCDDLVPTVNPGAAEACDGVDTDCDGIVQGDELDSDSDGLPACAGDCDDQDPLVNPEAPELCDNVDNNCNGLTDEGFDGDGDGFASCTDCDDADPSIYPGADELCDGLDNDCDATTEFAGGEGDLDGDGAPACADCNDEESTIFPGAPELCDGIDNDCDPSTEAVGGEADSDGDLALDCEDCSPADPDTYPGAPELCDLADNDCDGTLWDQETDDDGDGFVECTGDDCDDGDSTVNIAAAEACFDTSDSNCDGTINEGCTCPIWAGLTTPSNCTEEGTYGCPYESIDDAIDEAADTPSCGTVWIQPGVYAETLELDDAVIIQGAGDPADVVIDGQQNGTVIEVGSGVTTLISSLTITGGEAVVGGGLRALSGSSVSLSDVFFEANQCEAGGLGGAVFLVETIFSIVDCEFLANDCGFGGDSEGNDGGAIFSTASSGIIEGSLFLGNTAGDGSSVYLEDNGIFVQVSQNLFLEGQTDDSNDPFGGEVEGGALVLDSAATYITNNLFGGNTATEGGGAISLVSGGSSVQILNNVMIYNESPEGGGIYFDSDSLFTTYSTVANNIIVDNVGWGMFTEGPILGGIIANNNLLGNSLGFYGNALTPLPTPASNLSVAPQFVSVSNDGNWSNDDFSLAPGSLCIDAGLVGTLYTDVDGTINDLGLFGGPYGDWDGP